MTAPVRAYFEDIVLDHVSETPAMTVTEAHVGLYQGVSGESAADAGLVPDLLLPCLSTGLGWRLARPPLVVLAFTGLDWQILRPLRVGDTVHSRTRAVAKRALREGGVLVEEHEIVDQDGQVVQRGKFSFLVAKRPKEVPS